MSAKPQRKELELNLVSHSHWDREWYMSHAKHNYRLVKLMDALINTFERDKNFKSFHLDGQILILKDYLEIRPEKIEIIKKLISENKLKIGPFYILQDEFLISGEFNVRNVLYGLKECGKFGTPSMTGYFPDAFGNIGQMPQIMQGFNIDNAFFGRGIIPTGYANEVLGKSDEGFSEIIWRGADGSEIIGVQFVNWYHNAYQIPTEEKECLETLKHIISSTGEVARTPFLLGMNGCDHQPVQTDLSKVLEIAKSLDVKVVHSSLEEYIAKIKPYKDSFYKYSGEIVGQNGSGFGTLIGTASSRIYLKQLNYLAQNLITAKAEPLAVMASKYGIEYDSDLIYWCCLKLMENHPHDSICGCGVDEIHKKMEVRFMDAIDTAQSYLFDLKNKLSEKIECSYDKNIIVFNTDCKKQCGAVECFIDYKEDEVVPKDFSIIDDNGKDVPFDIVVEGLVPKYILPDDRFREVFRVKRFKVKLFTETMPTTFSRYSVVDKIKKPHGEIAASKNSMSNGLISVEFNANGSFNLTDSSLGKTIYNQNYFCEVGDKGSEYEFIECGETYSTINDEAKIEIVNAGEVEATYKVTNNLMQQNGEILNIVSFISLERNSKLVKIKTVFNNSCPNHRVRAIFDCDVKSDYVFAEGQFDITKRKINPGVRWKNPHNPQRMSAFVMRKDESFGCIYPQRGLNEYEINLKTGATEITLVRCVGEMGDWFYFPTKDSQCFREITSYMAVEIFDSASENSTINDAYNFYLNPLTVAVQNKHEGFIKTPQSLVSIKEDGVIVQSCLKKCEQGDESVIRLYNPTENSCEIKFNNSFVLTNMAETSASRLINQKDTVLPKKIVTYKF